MEDQKKGTGMKDLLAILAGLVATAALAAILYPLESLAFDAFFDLDWHGDKGLTTNDYLLHLSFALWFGVSATGGGLVCSLIAKTGKFYYVYILTILVMLFLIILSGLPSSSSDWLFFSMTIALTCIGYLIGVNWGIRIREKRKAA